MNSGATLVRGRLLALLVALFVGIPAYSLLPVGLRRVAEPATFQGGLELFVIFCLILLALAIRSGAARTAILVGSVLFYLRRHHVDLPAIVGLAYLETVVLLGAAAFRWPGPKRNAAIELIPLMFLTGLAIWTAGALALSAFKLGGPAELLLFTALASIAGLIANRRLVLVPLIVQGLGGGTFYRKLAVAFILTLFLMLLARTNHVLTYDSLWYGLRGNYVLAQTGSLFEPSGLVHSVHYYPKLFELFLLPLTYFGDFSFTLTASIAALGMLLISAYALLRAMRLEANSALFGVAIVASLPLVANLALQSKPDIINTFFLLTGAYCLLVGWRQGNWSYLLFCLAALILSWATKLTSLAYGVMLLLPWMLAAFVAWRNRWPRPPDLFRAAIWTCAGAAVVTLILTWRTYHLTGLPLVGPAALVDLLQALGMRAEPVVGLPQPTARARPESYWLLTWQYHFWPAPLFYVRLWWPGNVWLFLLGLTLFATRGNLWSWIRDVSVRWWPLLPVVGAGLILNLLVTGTQVGGVPYYHLIAFCLLNLIVVFEALRRFPERRLKSALAVFAAFHLSLILTIAPTGVSGTRKIDLDLSRSVWDTVEYKSRVLGRAGLAGIAEYLDNFGPQEPCRAIAHGFAHATHLLPCRVEAYHTIVRLKPDLLATPTRTAEYLRRFDVRVLIAPLWNTAGDFNRIFDCLASLPGAREHRDSRYRLLDIREVDLSGTIECPEETPRRVLVLEKYFSGAKVTPAGKAQPSKALKKESLSLIMKPVPTVAFQLRPQSSATIEVKMVPWARFFAMETGFRAVRPEVQRGCLLRIAATAGGQTTTLEHRPDPDHVAQLRLPWPADGTHPTVIKIEHVAEQPTCLQPLLLVSPRLVPR